MSQRSEWGYGSSGSTLNTTRFGSMGRYSVNSSSTFMSRSTSVASSATGFISLSQLVKSSNAGQEELLRRFRGWSPFRLMVFDLVENRFFNAAILAVILVNTVLIALQTDKDIDTNWGWYFALVDGVFLGVYVFEITAKLIAYRLDFFHNGWNNFDFFIVVMSVLEVLWLVLIGSVADFNPTIFRLLRLFRTIRAFRSLRILRTISFFQSLQIIVATLLKSVLAWGTISLLVLLVLYIFAIIGVTLYGTTNPARFGTLWDAIFSLFQLITLDDWFELYDNSNNPDISLIVYLILFIVIETFIFINLFVAVIVNNLDAAQRRNSAKIRRELQKKMRKRALLHKGMADFSLDSVAMHGHAPNVVGYDVDHYFDNMVTNSREKQDMGYSLMLLAALENNLEYMTTHRKTLDDLVDIVKEQPSE